MTTPAITTIHFPLGNNKVFWNLNYLNKEVFKTYLLILWLLLEDLMVQFRNMSNKLQAGEIGAFGMQANVCSVSFQK